MENIFVWSRRYIPKWAKQPYFWEVTKTACGEVAVLVLVFPIIDLYLSAPQAMRYKNLVVVGSSPILALAAFAMAVGAASQEKKLEKLEKGEVDWPSRS